MPYTGQPAGIPLGADWDLRALIARHQYSNTVANDVMSLLSDFYDELSDRIASGELKSSFQEERLRVLMQWAYARYQELARTARAQAAGALVLGGRAELSGMNAQGNNLRGVLGLPSRGQLLVAADFHNVIRNVDIAGALWPAWWSEHATRTLNRASLTIQKGYLEGIGSRALASRVNTLQEYDRHAINTTVRTAMTAVSTEAAIVMHEEFKEVIAWVRFEAVLDARTSDICRKYDNKRWKQNDPRIKKPPLHLNCRSALVAIPDFAALGITQAMLGERMTYDQWLRAQPAQVQDDILGPSRGQWYRNGQITLAEMVRSDGSSVTVKQLQSRLSRKARPSYSVSR